MRLASLCLCLITSAAGRRGGPGCALSAAVAAGRRVPRRPPRATAFRCARARLGPGGQDDFVWRRARLALEGRIYDDLEYQVDAELRDTEHPWRDVFLNYRRFNAAEVQGGKFKVPFGRDQLTSVFNNSFISRSLIGSQLSPGRDIGVMVHGRVRWREGELRGRVVRQRWRQRPVQRGPRRERVRGGAGRGHCSPDGSSSRPGRRRAGWPGACSSGSTPPPAMSRRAFWHARADVRRIRVFRPCLR